MMGRVLRGKYLKEGECRYRALYDLYDNGIMRYE